MEKYYYLYYEKGIFSNENSTSKDGHTLRLSGVKMLS